MLLIFVISMFKKRRMLLAT
jgi:hypothetical protein